MKKFLAQSLLIIILLVPQSVSAHLAGQPPFFKINGKYANLYPVPLTSLNDFALPQDLPQETYLVNQTLSFEFDVPKLPAPPEVVKKTRFAWDYGDGSKATGLSNTHTFTKMGSYLLKITADDGTTPTPQLIETVLLNILPDKNYSLPKSVIKVENTQSKDPLTDILRFSFNNSLHFDASSSQGGIVSYFWDLGDQNSSTQKSFDYTYQKDLTQVFPVLRVKDSNGFISDSFVELENSNQDPLSFTKTAPSSKPQTATKPSSGNKLFLIVGFFIIGALLFMARSSVRGRYRGRHR